MLSELNQTLCQFARNICDTFCKWIYYCGRRWFPETNRWQFGVLSSKPKPYWVLKNKTSGTRTWILHMERWGIESVIPALINHLGPTRTSEFVKRRHHVPVQIECMNSRLINRSKGASNHCWKTELRACIIPAILFVEPVWCRSHKLFVTALVFHIGCK